MGEKTITSGDPDASPPADNSPKIPSSARRESWVTRKGFGTDGVSTYKLEQRPAVGDTPAQWEWTLLVESATRFTADRYPAPDPDFPERSESAAEVQGASSDAEVSWLGTDGGTVTRVYRDVPTPDLMKGKHLKDSGRVALLGLSAVSDAKMGELFKAANELSQCYGPTSEVFYTVTGWHAREDGTPFFVTGGSVIDANGFVPEAVVRMDDRLRGYAPGSAPAGAELVDAFECVASLFGEAADARILVPQVLARLRAMFGVYRSLTDASADSGTVPTVWVSGNSGNGKSGAQAATANVFAPGLRHNSLPFKGGSPNNGGVSISAMEDLTFRARDLALDWDDLDPAEGEEQRAQWQSRLIRRMADQKSRTMAQRNGEARASKPARCAAIGNGEPLDAEQSAENRAVNILVGPGDVRVSTLAAMTGHADRVIRSGLGGGIVRELAGDLAGYRTHLAAARTALRPLFCGRDDAPGPVNRGADAMAELAAAGYIALLVMVKHGMSNRDARNHWKAIKAALLETWRGHLAVIGSGSRSSRALELIVEGIASGSVVISSAEKPGTPPGDARYHAGWKIDAFGAEPRRPLAGYVDDRGQAPSGDLWMLPTPTAGAVQDMVKRSGGTFSGGQKTLAQSLASDGQARRSGERNRNATVLRTLGNGIRPRVWEISADVLDGEASGGATITSGDFSAPIDITTLDGIALDVPAAMRGASESGDLETLAELVEAYAGDPSFGFTDEAISAMVARACEVEQEETPARVPALAGAMQSEVRSEARTDGSAGTAPADSPAAVAAIPAARVETAPAAPAAPAGRRGGSRSRRGPADGSGPARVHYRAPLAVADDEGTVYYPDGTSEAAGPFGSLAEAVEWAAGANLGTHQGFAGDNMGQLWLTPAAALAAGLPVAEPTRGSDAARDHAALEPVRAAGWAVRELRSVMTLSREAGAGKRWVRVAVAGWIDDRNAPIVAGVADGDVSAPELARRLGLHAQHLPTPFTVSSGVTFHEALKVTRTGGTAKRVEKVEGPRGADTYARREAPAFDNCHVDGISWTRKPTAEERAMPYAVAIDANGQFLGTMSNVEVGIGSARIIREPVEFDPSKPGYWRVEVPELDWRFPQVSPLAGKGPVWLPTPKVAELVELGQDVSPVEAQIYDERSRYFDKAQRAYRAARDLCHENMDDPAYAALLAQLKVEYSAGVAAFASMDYRGSEFYYPHWRHHVIGQSEANLSRKLRQIHAATGHVPVAVHRDAVVYLTDDPDPAALVAGTRLRIDPYALGQFKHVATSDPADVLALMDRRGTKAAPSQIVETIRKGNLS